MIGWIGVSFMTLTVKLCHYVWKKIIFTRIKKKSRSMRPFTVVTNFSYSIRNFQKLLCPLPCLKHKRTVKKTGKPMENAQALACIKRLWWGRGVRGEDLSVSRDTRFIGTGEAVVKMRYFYFCPIQLLISQTLPLLSEQPLLKIFVLGILQLQKEILVPFKFYVIIFN